LKDLFNYSYPEIDLENYLSKFKRERKQKIESLGEHKYSNNIKISQRFIEIKKLINKLGFNSVAHDNQIDTFKFLCDIYNLLFEERKMNCEQKEKIYLLQKRFEVFKKLFSRYYKKKFIKAVDTPASVRVYALFSIVLNYFYLNNNDYNAFNTSTKLIDLCLFGEYELKTDEIFLIEHAIGLELYCTEHCINNFSII